MNILKYIINLFRRNDYKIIGVYDRDPREDIKITGMHCRECGDAKPKHGFYPLFGMAYSDEGYPLLDSSIICNRCGLSDEAYLKMFKEPKDKLRKESI